MIKPSFVPDFGTYNSMYFPDGEVINDLAIAKRLDGEALKQHINFNGRQNIVSMPQYENDDLYHLSRVPRSVQTPVQMRQYIDSLKDNARNQKELAMGDKLQKSLMKFLND